MGSSRTPFRTPDGLWSVTAPSLLAGLVQQVCQRGAAMSVLPFPPGQPGRDLLEHPAVAVRVAERRVREVRAPGQVGEPGGLRLLLHLADVDAAADEIFASGVDVLDRQVHPLKGPGLHRRDARDSLPEVD